MTVYRHSPVPAEVEDLPRFLLDELEALEAAINVKEFLLLEETNVAPTRVTNGEVRLADGTNWNPGSGRGIYWWDGDTATWKLLG